MTAIGHLDLSGVAELLGVSTRTVYRWVSDHGLPSVETADGLRFDLREVQSWELDHRPTRRTTGATSGDVSTHILQAAIDVVATDGIESLTVERVAQRASMSVGGVTYHFATKQVLVEALVTRFIDTVEQQWREAHAGGLSLADAYIAVSLSDDDDLGGSRAILAATAADVATRARIDRTVRAWYRRIERASDEPDEAIRRCLAADAIWLFRVLGLHPLTSRRVGGLLRRST